MDPTTLNGRCLLLLQRLLCFHPDATPTLGPSGSVKSRTGGSVPGLRVQYSISSSLGLTDYHQVDMLGVRFEPVNLGANGVCAGFEVWVLAFGV